MGLFQCHFCGTQYNLSAQLEGREVRCHYCQNIVQITFSGSSLEELDAAYSYDNINIPDDDLTNPPTASPVHAISSDDFSSAAHLDSSRPSQSQERLQGFSHDDLPFARPQEAVSLHDEDNDIGSETAPQVKPKAPAPASFKKWEDDNPSIAARPVDFVPPQKIRTMSFTDVEEKGISEPLQSSHSTTPSPTQQPALPLNVALLGWSIFLLIALLFPMLVPGKNNQAVLYWPWNMPESVTSKGPLLFFLMWWFVVAVASITLSLISRSQLRSFVICALIFILVSLNPIAQIGQSGFFPASTLTKLLSKAHLLLLCFWLAFSLTISGSQLLTQYPKRTLPRVLAGVGSLFLAFTLLLPLLPNSTSLLEVFFSLGAQAWTVPLFGLGFVSISTLGLINIGNNPKHQPQNLKLSLNLSKIIVYTATLLSIVLFLVMTLYSLTRGQNGLLFFIFMAVKMFGLCYSILYLTSLGLIELLGAQLDPPPSLPTNHIKESIEVRLRTIQKLRDDGLITSDEFNQKRKYYMKKL